MVLAELDGLNDLNANGEKPLNNDPLSPNNAYFKHLDFVINEANKMGLTVAIRPT